MVAVSVIIQYVHILVRIVHLIVPNFLSRVAFQLQFPPTASFTNAAHLAARRCLSPEPYATTPLIGDMFRGPGGTRLPPNIPVSPGQSLGTAKQPSDDSCTKTASSDHSGSHASHRSHNFNNQSDKGEEALCRYY